MFNPTIVSSGGCCVTDESGKKYIDFEAGVWCTSLGHNNKQVNETMLRQMNSISHVGYRYTTRIVDEAAEKVLNLLGFADGKCVFLSSGSEAVEFGVQAARKIVDKPNFLCLKNHYLSAYGISASRSDEQWISLDLSAYNGDVDEFLSSILFDSIGAFVFEPGNASGTVKLPPKELIAAVGKKIRENGGIIIVNEVTAGVGRTGKWFGFQHYDIAPDIVCIGKGIGNGYPVSVIAISKGVAETVEQSGFRYAQSHQDDPLGCAVVNEVISIIERDKLIERAAQIGDVLKQKLVELSERHSCIKEVRGVGLMLAVEFHPNDDISVDTVHRKLFDAGFIAGCNPTANLIRFYPPLIIEEEHIRGMVSALDIILTRFQLGD